MHVIDMVYPGTRKFFATEASDFKTHIFHTFLEQAQKTVSFQRTINILILNAFKNCCNRIAILKNELEAISLPDCQL
jgi:hypothetical protein